MFLCGSHSLQLALSLVTCLVCVGDTGHPVSVRPATSGCEGHDQGSQGERCGGEDGHWRPERHRSGDVPHAGHGNEGTGRSVTRVASGAMTACFWESTLDVWTASVRVDGGIAVCVHICVRARAGFRLQILDTHVLNGNIAGLGATLDEVILNSNGFAEVFPEHKFQSAPPPPRTCSHARIVDAAIVFIVCAAALSAVLHLLVLAIVPCMWHADLHGVLVSRGGGPCVFLTRCCSR